MVCGAGLLEKTHKSLKSTAGWWYKIAPLGMILGATQFYQFNFEKDLGLAI